MAILEDKHSGAYMCKVLTETLSDFNILYNIKRYYNSPFFNIVYITNISLVLHEIMPRLIIL